MTLEEQLWRTSDGARHFICPDAAVRPEGALLIRSLAGDQAYVDPAWAARYEVTKAEAHAWASQEFGIALGDLRRRIDCKFGRMRISLDAAKHAPLRGDSAMTADALPAMLSLARALPRAILDSLSGDPARVVAANGRLAGVEARLNRAGIAVDHRLSAFPQRLTGLRADTAAARRDDEPT